MKPATNRSAASTARRRTSRSSPGFELLEGRPGEKRQVRRDKRQHAGAQETDEPAAAPPGGRPRAWRASIACRRRRQASKAPLRRLVNGPDFALPPAMTGRRNLITDVPGVLVGNAHDRALASGVTAALFDERRRSPPARCSAARRLPRDRLLEPEMIAPGADAVVLSGGSAFGLDAATGVQAWMRERGRGFAIGRDAGAARAAGDLVRPAQRRRQGLGTLPALSRPRLCGRRSGWARFRAWQRGRRLRRHDRRSQGRPRLGERGHRRPASPSALSSSSTPSPRLCIGDGPHFWAAPFEEGDEFGGLGLRRADRRRRCGGSHGRAARPAGDHHRARGDRRALEKAETKRLAVAANGGLHKALRFAHALDRRRHRLRRRDGAIAEAGRTSTG